MIEKTSDVYLLPQRPLLRANGPLYRQLADVLRDPIASGSYPVGSELPKEADIATRFSVSLMTVRQALRELEADGLIKKRSAKPALVAARNPSLNLSWDFKSFADIAEYTRDAVLDIKSYEKESSLLMARHFGMGKDEKGYCLRSVLTVGDQKRAQVTTYFPPDIGAQLKRKDFTDVLIFRSVQQRLNVRLEVAHVTVRAEIADETLAADLEIAEGAPVLTVEMLYQSADQRHIELSIARHPADLFSISYDAPNNLA